MKYTVEPGAIEVMTGKSSVDVQQVNLSKQDSIKIEEINAALLSSLAKAPEKIYELSSYKFELLIAELLRGMGYSIFHTSQTRDGGRDLLAVLKLPTGNEILTIVECKKYSPGNMIGIDIVQGFIWTIQQKDKANVGSIAPSSFFPATLKS